PDGKLFRELVAFTQDGLNIGGVLDAVNYKSELLATANPSVAVRFCDSECKLIGDISCDLSNAAYCTGTASGNQCRTCGDYYQKLGTSFPETPTFLACPGDEVRFRFMHGGGTNTNNGIEIFGHNWSEASYETLPEHCEAPTTQTNLFASQIMGDKNLCGEQ